MYIYIESHNILHRNILLSTDLPNSSARRMSNTKKISLAVGVMGKSNFYIYVRDSCGD